MLWPLLSSSTAMTRAILNGLTIGMGGLLSASLLGKGGEDASANQCLQGCTTVFVPMHVLYPPVCASGCKNKDGNGSTFRIVFLALERASFGTNVCCNGKFERNKRTKYGDMFCGGKTTCRLSSVPTAPRPTHGPRFLFLRQPGLGGSANLTQGIDANASKPRST